MPDDLDIHAASPDEIAAAHRNVFDIWSKGLPLDEHVRHRLTSPTHRRAEWFVGTVDGRVVTSLGCHPVRFRVDDKELPGIAIGSVYTVAEVRGRGFAPRLIEWVENHKRDRGAAISILYSDIKPDYYARQGYVPCPSFEGWCEAGGEQAADDPVAATARLVPFSVSERLPAVKRMYAEYHGVAPFSIARDEDYWTMMLEKFADDRFYALETRGNPWAGYLRVRRNGDDWRITDYALADDSRELAETMYAAFIAAARAGGAKRAGGWLPDSDAARNFFTLAPRRTEITMAKPLLDVELSARHISAAGRFCELDHV